MSATTDPSVKVVLISFGYKYGPPPDADFVFDARSLPNPFWDTTLRDLTGFDQPVIDYFQNKLEARVLVKQIVDIIRQHDTTTVTVAVGCTGGQHRSVYLVNALERMLRHPEVEVSISHRDFPQV